MMRTRCGRMKRPCQSRIIIALGGALPSRVRLEKIFRNIAEVKERHFRPAINLHSSIDLSSTKTQGIIDLTKKNR